MTDAVNSHSNSMYLTVIGLLVIVSDLDSPCFRVRQGFYRQAAWKFRMPYITP